MTDGPPTACQAFAADGEGYKVVVAVHDVEDAALPYAEPRPSTGVWPSRFGRAGLDDGIKWRKDAG